MCQRWWCGTPAQRKKKENAGGAERQHEGRKRRWSGTPAKKENMKYCKAVSAAVTLLTRTFPQNSVRLFSSAATGRIRLLTSAATILLLATNAWAGKPTAPAAPSNLAAAAASSTEIDLTWKDNSTTESGFKIESAPTSGGTWTQIATVGKGVTNYANVNLAASTTCYYRVRAYNSKNSTYSGVASATTLAGVACTFSCSPANASYPSDAASGSVAVTATSGCSWSATANDSWITVSS